MRAPPSPGLFPSFNSPAHNSLSLPPLSLPRGALGFGDADRRNLDPRGEPPPLSLSLSPLPLHPPLPHPTRPPMAARPTRLPRPRPRALASRAPRALPGPAFTRPPRSRPARRLGPAPAPQRPRWPPRPRLCGYMPRWLSCPGGLAPRAPARLACPRRTQRVVRCSTFSLICFSLF
jgi:hypothetical protein